MKKMKKKFIILISLFIVTASSVSALTLTNGYVWTTGWISSNGVIESQNLVNNLEYLKTRLSAVENRDIPYIGPRYCNNASTNKRKFTSSGDMYKCIKTVRPAPTYQTPRARRSKSHRYSYPACRSGYHRYYEYAEWKVTPTGKRYYTTSYCKKNGGNTRTYLWIKQ